MTAHPQPGARRYIENRTIPWINQEVREVSTIHLTNCGDELPSLTVLPTILHDPALQVYRLSGWRWQLDSGSILEHPSDLLQVLPGTLARPAGSFQFVEQILKFFRIQGHAICVLMNTYATKRELASDCFEERTFGFSEAMLKKHTWRTLLRKRVKSIRISFRQRPMELVRLPNYQPPGPVFRVHFRSSQTHRKRHRNFVAKSAEDARKQIASEAEEIYEIVQQLPEPASERQMDYLYASE
jgi:hypothetical protein